MTTPYDTADAGQPITALRWNNMQISIRNEIEALKATKLNLAGGTLTGNLEVARALAPKTTEDLLRLRSTAGNVGLRIETGTAPNDFAALRFYHGQNLSGHITADSGGRLSISSTLVVFSNRVGINVSGPQQSLHVGGRVVVDQGVIQRGGPSIVSTEDLGLYSQVPDNWIRIVTTGAPVRFCSDGNAGTVSNLDVLPTGDLKVRRNVLAARFGAGTDDPQELVHLSAPAGNVGIRINSGVAPADWSAIRFHHNNAERAFIGTHGPTGRLCISNIFNVWSDKVGVGPGSDQKGPGILDVRGDFLVVHPGTRNGLLINQAHTGWSNATRDRAEISVDPGYKTLMIIGSVAAAQDDPPNWAWPSHGRRVSLWDRLEVNGHLFSQSARIGGTAPHIRPIQPLHVEGGIAVDGGIIQRGGDKLAGTADLGLYSQVPGNWVRIVTSGGGIAFRNDGGIGTVSDADILPSGDLVVRRWASATRLGAGTNTPQDLLHVKAAAGWASLRIETGATGNDVAALRFFHGNTETGNLVTIPGRLSINSNVHVVGKTLGVGALGPQDTLHVKTDAGLTGLRLEAGVAAADATALRLCHGNDIRAVVGTSGIPGVGLQLLSNTPGNAIRYLTNGGPHIFAGDTLGNTPNLTIDAAGNGFFRGTLKADRYSAESSLVLNDYQVVNPTSNVILTSPPYDRDAWIYRDIATATANWGIYHRQIDSPVKGLPGNSIGFIGGNDSTLKAYINLANGSAGFTGAIIPAVGNSENAGIAFPADPGGGSGDRGFIRYHVESGETTTLRIGCNNDADDSIRLYQMSADRLIVQDGCVTIGSGAPYQSQNRRNLNVDGEIKSFGGGAGLRMADRTAPTTDGKDWVIYPYAGYLRFHNDTDNVVAWMNSNTFCVRKLRLWNKWLLAGDGDGEADDKWLRLKNTGGVNYYGGFAAFELWSSGGILQGSDLALKKDVAPIESSLDLVCKLRGVRYRLTDPQADDTEKLGLIAQEVQEVLPGLVTTGPDGHLGIQYNGLIAPLVEAIKEQQQQIGALRDELARLRERLA